MDKVFVLLEWYYEGDSNLVESFMGVYRTKEEAVEKSNKNFEFITFENYSTKETSDVYIEGYSPVEYGGYGSKIKNEIREITL